MKEDVQSSARVDDGRLDRAQSAQAMEAERVAGDVLHRLVVFFGGTTGHEIVCPLERLESGRDRRRGVEDDGDEQRQRMRQGALDVWTTKRHTE